MRMEWHSGLSWTRKTEAACHRKARGTIKETREEYRRRRMQRERFQYSRNREMLLYIKVEMR